MGLIVPDSIFVKMKYHTNISFSSSSVSFSVHQFNANSIYDPDQTGVGLQPTGFDQWKNFYNRYYVAASKIKVDFINLSATAVMKGHVLPSAINAEPTGGEDLDEMPYARNAIIPAAGSSNHRRVKHYMTTKKIHGRRGTEFESNYNGTYNPAGNPASLWAWNVIAENATGATNLALQADVTITYYVKLWGRVDLGVS